MVYHDRNTSEKINYEVDGTKYPKLNELWMEVERFCREVVDILKIMEQKQTEFKVILSLKDIFRQM